MRIFYYPAMRLGVRSALPQKPGQTTKIYNGLQQTWNLVYHENSSYGATITRFKLLFRFRRNIRLRVMLMNIKSAISICKFPHLNFLWVTALVNMLLQDTLASSFYAITLLFHQVIIQRPNIMRDRSDIAVSLCRGFHHFWCKTSCH